MAAPTALTVNYIRIQTLTSYFQHCRRSKRWINLKTVNRRSPFCQSLKRLGLYFPPGSDKQRLHAFMNKAPVFSYRAAHKRFFFFIIFLACININRTHRAYSHCFRRSFIRQIHFLRLNIPPPCGCHRHCLLILKQVFKYVVDHAL